MTVTPASRRRRILLLGALVVALGLLVLRLEPGGQINRCIALVRAAGAWPFFIAMAVLPVFGFPISPFTVAAGVVFGPTMGVGRVIACAVLAEIASMTICYWLAARVLRPWMERLLRWLGYALPGGPAGSAWEFILLVRIIPGPSFFMQNYLLGLARVPFGPYLLVSTVVHASFVVGTVLMGDALMLGDSRALAAGVLLCVAAGVAIYRIRKRWKRSPVSRATSVEFPKPDAAPAKEAAVRTDR